MRGTYEVEPGVFMAASCHHNKGKRSQGACGACYARAMSALSRIAQLSGEAGEMAANVLAEARRESGAAAPRAPAGEPLAKAAGR